MTDDNMDDLKRIEALVVSIGTLIEDLQRIERMLRLTPTKQRILTPALLGSDFHPSLTFFGRPLRRSGDAYTGRSMAKAECCSRPARVGRSVGREVYCNTEIYPDD